MGKLHELLAVEPDLAQTAKSDLKEANSLFASPEKFIGRLRRYRPLDEEGLPMPDESTEVATTVNREIDHLFDSFGEWLDVSIQKEETNQQTSADLVVNGTLIVESLSAPALLNLESKLTGLRAVLSMIPTNDTTEHWEWNEQDELWVSSPRTSYRTEKIVQSVVGYEATPEHPADVQYINQDVRVGEWNTVIRSGQYQPTQKRELLRRLDALIRATKQARQRANNTDAVNTKLSKVIFDYLME